MNKEVYHEGWLVKSPPTKRIWRARWRRRWFTLKQGEIPGQFCLEYYTDRNCRKLKGVIDLDQCEQVDCGLRLEHRKQKFQNMFDVKTPRRTYYLAADSEDDMNDWVKCICQVCNLQDLSKQSNDRQYYNVGVDALAHKPLLNYSDSPIESSQRNNSLNITETSTTSDSSSTKRQTEVVNPVDNTYENDNFSLVNSLYSNRETILCDAHVPSAVSQSKIVEQPSVARQQHTMKCPTEQNLDYYNLNSIATEAHKIQGIERSQSMKVENVSSVDTVSATAGHGRTQSFVEQRHTSIIRKIPENLNLADNYVDNSVPSPALSTCSGPYIPISECFSGSPILLDNNVPTTPLNSLDPRFYDTPRSHINIGLNLINNEQPYSPKRSNCLAMPPRPRSGRSSPTDSESVFTDDEEWTQNPNQAPLDRNLRPSDSSVENDSIVFTYAQRFSKKPDDIKSMEDDAPMTSTNNNTVKGPPRPPKRISGLLLDGVEDKNKENLSSDTENASPAIGPKDVTCCVEESYDIPRSHHLPYYNLNADTTSPKLEPINDIDIVASSTPNLVTDEVTSANKVIAPRSHFYSNAAPSKLGAGNVFRYDFIGQESAPAVNRSLKPKNISEDKSPIKESKEIIPENIQQAKIPESMAPPPPQVELKPPCIDRKLKPSTPKFETNSLRRKAGPNTFSLSIDGDVLITNQHHQMDFYSKTLPKNCYSSSMTNITVPTAKQTKQIGHLEYFDLDHSNPPPICQNSNNTSLYLPSTSSISTVTHHHNRPPNRSVTDLSSIFPKVQQQESSGIVYKSVDFVKTEAIKRTRQDTELNRAKHLLKD